MRTTRERFTPDMITANMKEAAKSLVCAMAYVQTIKPVVDAYHQKILDEMQPVVSDIWPRIAGKRITDIRESYLMGDEEHTEYLRRVNEERIKAGFVVENEDYCPLLVAEHEQVKAEWAFISAMEPLTGINNDSPLYGENREKYLKLCLGLVVPLLNK